jgi:amino acid transporter
MIRMVFWVLGDGCMAEHLKRRIGLGLLTAYGVGVMIGAGIYVLVGAVAADAGLWAPVAFLLAGIIAAPTALSYSEFASRIPEAAGEAAYVGRGLSSQSLAVFVGLAIVLVGSVSAAAVLRGGVGYLITLVDVSTVWSIVVFGLVLTGVAVLGVMESLALAAVFTAVELIGLTLVVWAGFSVEPVAPITMPPSFAWVGIGAGAVLAFFAFIGFEDIVNMAEEVENPERTIPRAIIIALLITTVIYALVAYAAIRAVPLNALGASEQPLALVWQAGSGGQARFLSTIAVFATMNGVLAQIVMASRVLFGLGRRNEMLSAFHHAHPRTGTPILATVLVGVFVVTGALALPVAVLAEATSSILLVVFILVNVALIREKRLRPDAGFKVPMAVPVVGFLLSAAALLGNLAETLS